MTLSLTNFDAPPGIIHLSIEGKWSVLEFTRLLERIRFLYIDISALDLVDIHYHRYGPFSGGDNFASVEEAHQFYKSVCVYLTGDTYIHTILYESPGWFELIGNLNPLKVISDLITAWRKENTEREKNRQS